MQVRAVRVVSGKVTVYDRQALKPVPLPGATVRMTDLSLEVRTGADGAYVFRNLPAGTHTLAVVYSGKEVVSTIVVPADPANIRDVDIDAGPK
jgi:hypothetical protein